MSSLVLFALSASLWQDALPPAVDTAPPPALKQKAAEQATEPGVCARRETYAREEVERFRRDHPNATAAHLRDIRRQALEMFQASSDLAAPQGSPPPDFAVLCAAGAPR